MRDHSVISVGIDCSNSKSRTQQHHRDACSINGIIARARRRGGLPPINFQEQNFGDFTAIDDYQTACNKILAGQQAFDALPSSVRKRFGNDPINLFNFLDDDKNRVEAIELGLIPPPTEEERKAAEEAAKAAAAAASGTPPESGETTPQA